MNSKKNLISMSLFLCMFFSMFAQTSLNKANIEKVTYTLISGGTVTNQAEGKAKILVFFQANDVKSRDSAKNICAKYEDFSNVDIVFIETKRSSKAVVTKFRDTYATSSAKVCYDTTTAANNSMKEYTKLLVGSAASIANPFIVYIDKNNKIQYEEHGIKLTESHAKEIATSYLGLNFTQASSSIAQNSSNNSQSSSSNSQASSSNGKKTTSTYKYGIRNVSFVKRQSGNGIMFTSTISPAKKADFSKIDEYAKKLEIPFESNISISDAALLITKNSKTQVEKARAIFTWISNNISYYDSSVNYDSVYYALPTFRIRTGVCQGFSKLFQEMCSAVGIKADYVSGYAKSSYLSSDTSKFSAPESHGWNLVHTDEGDFFVDTTWAANAVNRGGLYAFSDIWFAPDPCYFITSHYPKEVRFQLLSSAMSIDDFVTLPRIDPDFEKIGFDGKEVLEFVYSHLDSWKPVCTTIFEAVYKGNTVDLITLPFSDILIANQNYDGSYKVNGLVKSENLSTGTYQIIHLDIEGSNPSSFVLYAIKSGYATDRATIAKWSKPSQYQEKGDFVDPIKVKAEIKASLAKDGSIIINGYTIPHSAQITVVPKGKTATITGSEVIAPEPYVDKYETQAQWLENDSAFPVGRTVKLSAYSIGQYPVSIELYKKIMQSVETPEYKSMNRSLPASRAQIQHNDKWITYQWVAEDSYATMTYCQAALFCNALTKLLMSDADCVYSFADIEIKNSTLGTNSLLDYSEELIQKICEAQNIKREQIGGIGIDATERYGNQYLDAYIKADLTKKGFRLPTDAEWEFAARGANQKDSVNWNIKRSEIIDNDWPGTIKPMLLGSRNNLGLEDLGLNYSYDYYFYPNRPKRIWPNKGEFVEDKLVTNRDYKFAEYTDSDGSVKNPCFIGGIVVDHSFRQDVDRRERFTKLKAGGYEVGTLRLVRTLE